MPDINKIKSGQPVKNGTIVMLVMPGGTYVVKNDNVTNPDYLTLESRVADRFDDINYYTCSG